MRLPAKALSLFAAAGLLVAGGVAVARLPHTGAEAVRPAGAARTVAHARSVPAPAPPQKPTGRLAAVLPKPEEERWLQVPWRTDVTRARAEAQRTGKPLFFWIMDGSPLGCT